MLLEETLCIVMFLGGYWFGYCTGCKSIHKALKVLKSLIRKSEVKIQNGINWMSSKLGNVE